MNQSSLSATNRSINRFHQKFNPELTEWQQFQLDHHKDLITNYRMWETLAIKVEKKSVNAGNSRGMYAKVFSF